MDPEVGAPTPAPQSPEQTIPGERGQNNEPER
jgi:hypothetical protein